MFYFFFKRGREGGRGLENRNTYFKRLHRFADGLLCRWHYIYTHLHRATSVPKIYQYFESGTHSLNGNRPGILNPSPLLRALNLCTEPKNV